MSENSNLPKYFIRAFRAIDDHASCVLFFEGHTKVLTDFGISNLNTAEPSWIYDPEVYVIIATDEVGEVVGGLRVHKYPSKLTMPLVDALYDLDPRIQNLFDRSLPIGTAEVCGLWNAKKVFGKGISPLLCICSVVIVTRLGLNDFYCFSAPHTEKMIKTNGCVDVTEIGNGGRFFYPTEEFISIVLYHPNVHALEYAADFNKSRILALVENPNQPFVEKAPRGDFIVEYALAF